MQVARGHLMIVRFFNALGAGVLRFFIQYVGEVVLLAVDTFRSIFTHKLRWKLFLNQIVEIGLLSQLVVVITGGFTGAVFAAQAYFQFNKLGMGSGVGAVVSVALCRELAPVLTALMVAGRVGAAMSAEIGTMKVTEQIDALRALAVYPIDYLVVPRALAMMLSMPLLVAECIGFGIAAGYFTAVYLLEIERHLLHGEHGALDADARHHHGVDQGVLFRAAHRFHQLPQRTDRARRRGRRRPGHDRRRSVNASLAVLIFNFFLTMFLNIIFPAGYQ